MRDPLVSIIIRSFNEGWALRETLPALRAQNFKHWELIVIDSGSTDGSVDLIRAAQPQHFIQIESRDYNPARVINRGMELARSMFGIFLNADATPQNENWLRPLVEKLFHPKTAAVFGRQIPRPDCKAVFAHDYERCFGLNQVVAALYERRNRQSQTAATNCGNDTGFVLSPSSALRAPSPPLGEKAGMRGRLASTIPNLNKFSSILQDNRESKNWPHFFSMASSGIRKNIWARRGFDERMRYSEDDEYTRWCVAQGYKIIYAPESVVMHSHNYSPREAWTRSFGEAKALAAVWPGRVGDFHFARTVLFGWLNDARRDLIFCAKKNCLREWPHALRIRWNQRCAKLAGFRDGWKFYRENSQQGGAPAGSVPSEARGRVRALNDATCRVEENRRQVAALQISLEQKWDYADGK